MKKIFLGNFSSPHSNSTYICDEHNYSRRSSFGGNCPICKQPLKCIGYRLRLSKGGKLKIKNFRKKPAQIKRKQFNGVVV